MKVRTDPWLIVGLILALLLSAYNTIMEWRGSQARVSESPDTIRPFIVPSGGQAGENSEFLGQDFPLFPQGGGGTGGQGDSVSPSPPDDR